MKIRLDTAKNASVTCVVDGRFLHSKYNPENEAKSFVDSIDCNYAPSCVFMLGASLPYCIYLLKKRFPKIPICAIQYNAFFLSKSQEYDQYFATDTTWTNTFLCDENTSEAVLCEEIFSALGETLLAAPLVLEWKAAHASFSNESSKAWLAMRLVIKKTNSILITRSYFSQRWLKNMVKFCIYSKNITSVKEIDLPVLLVASGSSLKYHLKTIREAQNSFFILALSSSLAVLLENRIIPDLCISTDGGYYAQKHLDILRKYKNPNIAIPIAISPESNIACEILENAPIIPFTYNDGIESVFLKACGIEAINAQRNGTVSGTAAEFALSITDKNVYAVGLDLAMNSGYSHAQPNEHEKIHAPNDFRLKPLSSRLIDARYAYSIDLLTPMEIYKQWFSTRGEKFSKRFFRILADDFLYENSLGSIEDVPWSNVTHEKNRKKKKNFFTSNLSDSNSERKVKVKKIINSEKKMPSTLWLEHCAPTEYIAVKKYPSSLEHQENLVRKFKHCIDSIEGLYT